MEIIVLLRKIAAALQSKETLQNYLFYEMGELLYERDDEFSKQALLALEKLKRGEKPAWQQLITSLAKTYEQFYHKGNKPALFWLSQTEALDKQRMLIQAFSCALFISITYYHLQHHCSPTESDEQGLAAKRKYIQAANDTFEGYVEATYTLALIINCSGSDRLNGYTPTRMLDKQIKLERGHWHLLKEWLTKL